MSTLSGAKPEIRTRPHLFIELEQLHAFLAEWTQSGDHLQPEIANYLKGHFLGEPLRDWDISRPAPVLRLRDPRQPRQLLVRLVRRADRLHRLARSSGATAHGEKLDDWWQSPDCEIHHFIGKDITYFHTLFWPGMLKTAGFSLPTKVHIHGFLTVDGEKMSKIEGHVRRRPHLPQPSRPQRTCATSTPRSSRRASTTSI